MHSCGSIGYAGFAQRGELVYASVFMLEGANDFIDYYNQGGNYVNFQQKQRVSIELKGGCAMISNIV